MKHTNITVNGKQYDRHTGAVVGDGESSEAQTHSRTAVHAASIHQIHQRSKTLRRQSLKAAAPTKNVRITVKSGDTVVHHRSSAITRFAPHPVVTKTSQQHVEPDIPAQPHAFSAKLAQKPAHTQPVQTSKEIKDQAIQKALAHAPSDNKQPEKRRSHIFSMASGGLALLLLAGYLTYISMPTISIRIAAAQSGINASYPSYQPTGYSLAGPIGYSDGQVSIAFNANAGPENYTINEEATSWDSSALLENSVIPASSGQYITHHQGGLTIYTFDNTATWVNGGIRYEIIGNAPLSDEQILKIASSL